MVMSSHNEENQGQKMPDTVKIRQAEEVAENSALLDNDAGEKELEPKNASELATKPEGATGQASLGLRRVVEPQKLETARVAAEASVEIEETKSSEVESMEDFSELLEENESLLERKKCRVGQVVEGSIVQIGSEFVYVDIGAKSEACLPLAEILNPETGKLSQIVGDTIKARVVSVNQNGIHLSRSMRSTGNYALEEAYHAGLAVKATVKGVNKGGYELSVMGQRAFCPLSQISKTFTQEPSEHIGKSYDFKIIKFSKKGRDIVLSRTALQDEERKQQRAELLEKLKVGAVLNGAVTSIHDYGVFVDLGGLDGLIHVSELSFKHVGNPKEFLSVGQEVMVYVLNIEESPKGPKLSLSMKKLEQDPFIEAESWLVVGATVPGIVRRNTKFGSFVELAPGIEGLVHISELSWDRSFKRVDDVVKVGQNVQVSILSIDLEERRIGLSLKDTTPNPWDDAAERYPVGTPLTGIVERIADFGIFVKIEPGLVALLPLSEIGAQTQELRRANVGDTVEAHVIAVDTERLRLTLSTKAEGEESPAPSKKPARRYNDDAPRQRRDNRDSRDRRGAKSEEYREVKGSFASFGDVFSELKKKK
ncbi:MAG: S1 RNA-binding domain-containing protein [Bradymonadia bacterium]|jgi:small subunit ribosomal protein S1